MVDIGGGKHFPLGWSGVAKPCDACKTVASLLFCRTDSTFMCMGCDTKLHGDNRHERVWMCEVCEQAPASVTCKADAASLCVACDRDIHSANPLARRHERIPVVPFYNTAVSVVKSTAAGIIDGPATPVAAESNSVFIGYEDSKSKICLGHEKCNSSNWLRSNNNNNISKLSADIQADMKSIELLFTDPDNILEFDYPIPNDHQQLYNHQNSGMDSVVPVQMNQKTLPPPQSYQSVDNHFEIDFTSSTMNSSYTAQSISQNMNSSSSMDVGIVPDGSSISEMSSYPFAIQVSNNIIDSNASTGQSSMGMDREARVMRYREKRKNRKFEKTIRYASRKAYAETRPRIKGRFAKRSESSDELPVDVDRWFTSGVTTLSPTTTAFLGEPGFGVVPSF